jgi:hypothetical protein
LRRARCPLPRHERQRLRLRLPRLSRRVRRAPGPPSPDAAVHASDERQGGTLHSDALARMGLRPAVCDFSSPSARAATMAPFLQSRAPAREFESRRALVTTPERCLMNNVLDLNS